MSRRTARNLASVMLACAAALSGAAAHAMDVGVYGRLDVAVHYSNNNGPQGQRLLEVIPGIASSSRWGVRGSEDLGDGMRALFQVEGGINPDVGTATKGGAPFGRNVVVGLQSALGSLSYGLQNTPIVESLDEPFGWANLYEGGFLYANYVTKRWDNTIRYATSAGPFAMTAIVGLGEQPGDSRKSRNAGGSFAYTQGALTLNAACQQMRNPAGVAVHKAYSLSGVHQAGPFKFYLGWLGHRSDISPQRNDVWNTGLSYRVAPSIELIAAVYDDRQHAVKGDKRSVAAMFNYLFSKTVNAYLQADFTRIDEGYTHNVFDTNGFAYPLGIRSRTSVTTGLRVQWL